MRRPLLCAIVALLPGTAPAQIPLISDIFGKVQDVNTSFGFARLLGPSDVAGHLRMVTFEVTLSVASLGCRNATALSRRDDSCARRDSAAAAQRLLRRQCAISHNTMPTPAECAALAKEESHEETERVVELRRGDTTVIIHSKPARADPELTVPRFSFEIGLSYGQLTGFHQAGSGFTLSGALEEFPVVATYVDFLPEGRITPYVAARAGLTKLSGLRAYGPSDLLYTASGNTYLIGGGVGVAITLKGPLVAYAEYDATFRTVPSVEWAAHDDGVVPGYLPRRLRLSTHELSLGMQVNVRR